MSASLRALLAHILDYAGLFPPANLPLERAIRNYARHRAGGEQWMLGRFILPAARLAELAAFDKLFEETPPFVFAVLGRGGKTADDFVQALGDDLNDVAEFRKRHAGRVEVDVLEVKLPEELIKPENYQAACYTLIRVADLIERFGPTALRVFYEVGLSGEWRSAVQDAVALLHRLAGFAEMRLYGAKQHNRGAGFKLRCAGQKPGTFPSPEQIAGVLVACRDRRLALKATAGLHHPIRRLDPNGKAHTHGFLNLFGGAVLAMVHGLDEDKVRTIIEDENASHFVFDDATFSWQDLSASVDDIVACRQRFAVAFGSCSFDEPREDLRALQLLE